MLKIDLWDLSCKYYNFKEKKCKKHNKECFMCNDYKIAVEEFEGEIRGIK